MDSYVLSIIKHNQTIALESGIYEIFRVLDVPTLTEELSTFEQMFTNINDRIQEDEFLQNVLEALTLQNLPIPKAVRSKNRAIKKSRYRAKTKGSEETKAVDVDLNVNGNGHHDVNHEAEEEKTDRMETENENKSTPKRRRRRSRKLEESSGKGDGEGKSENKDQEKRKRLRLRKRNRNKNKTISQMIESVVVPNPNKPQIEIDVIKGSPVNHATAAATAADTKITLRKKQSGSALNYNLRGEIKANSKSKFDFLQDFSAPKKHKTKAVTETNKLLTTEEKKKVYWNDFNEYFFRKPYTDEAELLMPNATHDIVPIIESEVQQAASPLLMGEEDEFSNAYEAHELMAYARPPFIPSIFNPEDSLKVMFEFTNNNVETATTKKSHNLLAYFRMKKKAQTEMPLPEDLTDIKAFSNPKYDAISSFDFHKIKDEFLNGLKPQNYNPDWKFNDHNIDELDLSAEGFHKLFGLKHLEYLNPEDTLDIKAKVMFGKEMAALEEQKIFDSGIDELSKEILYTEYFMNNFLVNENNTKKSKLTYKLKESDAFLKSEKLLERSKKLESDSKLQVIKKYLQLGVSDKTSNWVSRGYVRNNKDQIVSALTFVPKVDKDTNVIRISREVKHLSLVETDCCICFCNLFTEYNPIIYCSNCNASFHKFCYGLPELPSEDFFCDVCLATNDPSTRKAIKGSNTKVKKSSSNVKMVKPVSTQNADLKCGICGIEDYPLKKYRKNDWYHLTCLIMHDMTQYKNGEWMLKQEKNNVLEQVKNEGSQFECFICKSKIGIVVSCEDTTCTKHFHALCAYVSGYKMRLVDYDDHKDDKARNGMRPIIQCPDHSDDPHRETLKQQYFRRYTTNFRNTLSYETWEDYAVYLAEEEEESQNAIKTEYMSTSQTQMIEEPPLPTLNGQIQVETKDPNSLRREPEVSTETLESDFIGGPVKKIKGEEDQEDLQKN